MIWIKPLSERKIVMALRCPNCGSDKYKVVDSRQSADKPAIRRRRQCLECDFLFSTNETYVRKIYVMDQKGNSQPYSTYRLKLSLVDAAQDSNIFIQQAINDLEEEILAYVPKKKSIPSSYIAERVMAYLKPRDWKAYVRYAIDHAGITDLFEFIDMLVRDKDKDNEIIEPKRSTDDDDDF